MGKRRREVMESWDNLRDWWLQYAPEDVQAMASWMPVTTQAEIACARAEYESERRLAYMREATNRYRERRRQHERDAEVR
jgi:hypothetical protein